MTPAFAKLTENIIFHGFDIQTEALQSALPQQQILKLGKDMKMLFFPFQEMVCFSPERLMANI